ncbi:ADP-ribosylation factor(Arf)/Arf-like (Arl) small GTPase family protein (macronuclear) [Tetrahymena thermophila SB210]|uniref:ADP-ribosylation factor(Arf)/Arf-like (Arl) small GTPase family protein n=1 Tax=Tetrahymena thermophila (strain SB210) TaxID=312017 RepID=I7MLV8_TETTS|nr:ADP-ribosylation factor(Arf)/Arf-like (Arl) small GTPase family protein [Tetrahymena thermophila SB210]EAS03157.1 ADP-ribosylation factor(Arf)/Arf-like (Arl) small GTPase family protein [Tetrahymena thermophila SB210]|eukprot:XP_001023402.1 ADP-ribosylation factor(Arf)/Arf-like (Arl) small GTPase family protein [Tetrahymena thermophila SB210]
MFIFDFFKNMLGYLGLYKKNGKILFLGLDNAGKTTLLRRLKDGRLVQHDPTLGSHTEELVLGNIRFKAFDLGGHEAVRKTWKNYFASIDGIVYLVDSSDRARFEESRIEFNKIIQTKELEKVPIVILGNKIDIQGAASEDELRINFGLANTSQIGIEKISEIDGRPIELFMCSVSKKIGYADGFQWLSKFLK